MGRILSTLQQTKRVLLGQVNAGRAATVYQDDIFLVSYPKSGNTWIRFLISNLVYPDEPATFANIESRVPSIYMLPDRVLRGFPRPRILKSHECFMPWYRNVIYIVRDPRDVAVSYYHYNLKKGLLPPASSMQDYIPQFLADELDMRCGAWGDHVMSWMCMKETRDKFLLLRYEDVLASAETELARVAQFLNLPITQERLQHAVRFSSADRMRDLEKKQGKDWAFAKGMRRDIPFVRAAVSGSWRSGLPPDSVREIEAAWGNVMQELGYPLSEDLQTAPKVHQPVS